jgi:integrase
VFDRPTTAKSRRSVGLTPDTVAVLKEHRQRQQAAGLGEDDSLVFCSGKGTSLNPSNVRNRPFKPLLRRAGLPDLTCHAATRHTYATLLLSKGVHLKIVQELLGHAQIGLTLDTYSHVLPGMGDGAVRAIQDMLSEPER